MSISHMTHRFARVPHIQNTVYFTYYIDLLGGSIDSRPRLHESILNPCRPLLRVRGILEDRPET